MKAAALNEATIAGPRSTQYTKLVSDLVTQLRTFYKIEENVNPTSSKFLNIHAWINFLFIVK